MATNTEAPTTSEDKTTERLSDEEVQEILQECGQKGTELELTFERRGQIPGHWDRHKTKTVTITKGAGPNADRASEHYTPHDLYAVDEKEEVRLSRDNELFAKRRDSDQLRVQIGYLTDITKL